MNFLFRKLFRNIPPEKEAKFLTKMVSGSAYSVFLDKHFRELVKFEKQEQVEKDRIFNELVVNGLLLLLSSIKDNFSRIESARQNFWQVVHEKIPETFVDWLNQLGVQKKDIWKKLIDLRIKEYEEKKNWTRETWVEEIFKNRDNERLNDAMVRVETLTVSGMSHITRGKAKRNDPLRRHLRTWLSVLNNKLESRIGW